VDWLGDRSLLCGRQSSQESEQGLSGHRFRKYGYPPDLQDATVQNILQQAEALSADWAA
jgi:type I restriction enzyme R subunit